MFLPALALFLAVAFPHQLCIAAFFMQIPVLLLPMRHPLPPPLLRTPPPLFQVESVFLNMPNLHFIPCAPVGSKFEDDVYVATSEPHGEEGRQGRSHLGGGGSTL